MSQAKRFLFFGVVALTAFAGPAFAQEAAPADEFDPMDSPTEYGVRFTPGMARAIAGTMTKELFVRRYELDAAKADEVSETLARRFMQFAHQHEEAGQDLNEFFFESLSEHAAKKHKESSEGIPKELAQGLGTRLVPMLPAIRELANGVMEDVRPNLGFKQQLKLTGEVAMMNVALDAFEKNMQKWSRGEVQPFSDPFRNDEAELKEDAGGETQALKNARQRADAQAKAVTGTDWDAYVAEAKKYYELDASQSAAADSLLRDYKERARVAVGNEEEWRAKVYRNRFWTDFSMSLPGRWNNPLRLLLDREWDQMRMPLNALGEDLKRRIDEIPTVAQRDAADRRVEAELASKGLSVPEQSAPATAPAADVESPK